PGQFLVGRVMTQEARAGLLVPRRAIQDDRVWVALPLGDGLGRLERRQVTVVRYLEGEFLEVDARETQWAVVEDGVEAGGPDAGGMAGDLQDGQMVRLAEEPASARRREPAGQPAGGVAPPARAPVGSGSAGGAEDSSSAPAQRGGEGGR